MKPTSARTQKITPVSGLKTTLFCRGNPIHGRSYTHGTCVRHIWKISVCSCCFMSALSYSILSHSTLRCFSYSAPSSSILRQSTLRYSSSSQLIFSAPRSATRTDSILSYTLLGAILAASLPILLSGPLLATLLLTSHGLYSQLLFLVLSSPHRHLFYSQVLCSLRCSYLLESQLVYSQLLYSHKQAHFCGTSLQSWSSMCPQQQSGTNTGRYNRHKIESS